MPFPKTKKNILSEDSFSDNEMLWNILEGTASKTGEEFFRALVENLAAATGVYGCFLTEYHPKSETAKTLAFWTEDGWIEDYVYSVAGTPCERVFKGEEFLHVEDHVAELFPADLDFKEMGIASYMGEPLKGIDNRVIGHLSVIDKKPLLAEAHILALFQIFAARAAAERKRLDAEQAIREREEKLARLFEGTMDAIIELDSELKITQFNAAAAELFGCKAEHTVGFQFADLIAPIAQAAFTALAADLAKGGSGRRAAWIREGFQARRGDGTFFPAEASLSCSRTDRERFFTVVLRNVEDRIRAEARIKALSSETQELKAKIEALRSPGEIIGNSPAYRKVLGAIDQVAGVDSTVLLTGETGTGKELVARAIHAASRRVNGPLIRVNCSALSANLIESEFFGHKKGAFTGATSKREGRFKLADGGTIFLDEIGELPLELQPKLLRILQEGEFEPVGGSVTEKIDVRVIAATNRNLEKEVSENHFREDLFYRLNVFPIHLPPLRERGADIGLLAESFAERLADEMGKPFTGLTEQCRKYLSTYPWPGNVRELQNVIERALLYSAGGGTLDLAAALPHSSLNSITVDTSGFEDKCPEDSTDQILTDSDFRVMERSNMIRALESCDWRISGENGAATLLGLNASTLTSRMKALGIEKPEA